MSFSNAKIALVFDWMTNQGGAERVNLVLHKMFPDAPIFTSVYNSDKLKGFEQAKIHTSFIQKLPFAKTKHQLYLGLMPYAYEQFDLSEFDIIISSSHSCAKGVITKSDSTHICYCHSPMRYAWDNWQQYIEEYKIPKLIKKIGKIKIHKIRMWDRLSADRVDHFIANSSTTQKRISKYYRRESKVIPPMINIKDFKTSNKEKTYYLAVGRLIPYKKFDLIIETFNKNKLPLKIVGTGVSAEELKKKAKANIEFLGFTSEEKLKQLYSECEALIFPQLEDFGITPLEAMASSRPVIAFGKGGALDTIIDGKTGIYFPEQTAESLQTSIEKYQNTKNKLKAEEIKAQAEKFDEKHFKKQIYEFIKEKI